MYYDAPKGDHDLPYNPFESLVVPLSVVGRSHRGIPGRRTVAPAGGRLNEVEGRGGPDIFQAGGY